MEEEGSGTIEGWYCSVEVETGRWRGVSREGCVGTVEVRRWRMWNTGCWYWHG